jgi:redox-sensitive bicupin YhaK (pirin superfamily)
MIKIRKSEDRGHAQHGWLDSYFSFSFADYYDPQFMGFRHLRVINEDRVQPGQGFGTHPHKDMEIITFVLEGSLEHKDSMGTGSIIKPGEIQAMSAGTGVTHSEFNPSKKDLVHLLQIWILPERKGIKPSYQQKSFTEEQRRGKLHLLASGRASDGAAKISQDVELFTAVLTKDQKLDYPLKSGRHAWVQVTKGALSLNGNSLKAGDGAAVSDEKLLDLITQNSAEFLLFDLA